MKGQASGPILARVPPSGLGGKGPCAIKHPKCEKLNNCSKFYEDSLKEDMFPWGYHFGL